jgi:hypothetical protein
MAPQNFIFHRIKLYIYGDGIYWLSFYIIAGRHATCGLLLKKTKGIKVA